MQHISPHISPRIGVEIEFTGISEDDAIQMIRQAELPAHYENYHHNTRDYWRVTTDSSCGLEAVSPPLAYHEREQVRTVMRALRDAGAVVNRNCGYHVHHEWPWWEEIDDDEAVDRLNRLRNLYRAAEPLHRALLSPSRWSNSYCKPASELQGLDLDDLDRYVDINVVSLPRQGTVEFRQHQGTLNGVKALAWMAWTRSLVHAASIRDCDDRVDLCWDKLPQSTITYFESRLEGTPVSTVKQLMRNNMSDIN